MGTRSKVPRRAFWGGLFALGLLAAPEDALAQGAPVTVSPVDLDVDLNRVPWPAGQVFGSTDGPDWARIVSDTFATFKTFADLSRYSGSTGITPAVPATIPTPLWREHRPYIPQNSDVTRIYLGNLEAKLMPVEFSSTIVAESRGLQGVLIGLSVELPELY